MTEASSTLSVEQKRHELVDQLLEGLRRVYRGPRQAVELLATAFFAGGHVLLEDIPGVGKTTLARALACSIAGSFRRIQCTPDLMPSDITGISIYDETNKEFKFHPGPAFCDILLADELNRTPPRTQSALLEAMNENQVSVDGVAKPLSDIFLCIATQNPQEQVGTYPLPESQSDRFLLRFALGYPDADEELILLENDGAEEQLEALQPVLDHAQVVAMRKQVRAITLSDDVRQYLLNIISATRSHNAILTGASPRAAIALQRACQALAFINKRDFVIPEDVQQLAQFCLAHRLVLRSGQDAQQVVDDIIDHTAVPR